jgi:hypothetical protein
VETSECIAKALVAYGVNPLVTWISSDAKHRRSKSVYVSCAVGVGTITDIGDEQESKLVSVL